MVEMHRRPAGRNVAILADIRGRDMIGGLARRSGAVVATGACSDRIGVGEMDRGPVRGDVTILANVRSSEMSLRFADGRGAVVAASTRRGNAGVIEARTRPRTGGMAILARRACRDVARRLALCPHAVMACLARTQRLRMVEVTNGRKGRCDVAVGAFLRRRQMRGRKSGRARSVVACAAFARRSRELALHMAGLAGDVQMCARERERSAIVIESGGRLRLGVCVRKQKSERNNANETGFQNICEERTGTIPKLRAATSPVTHSQLPTSFDSNRMKCRKNEFSPCGTERPLSSNFLFTCVRLR